VITSLLYRVNGAKTAAIVTVVLAGVVILLVLDVWLIGTAAAWLSGLPAFLAGYKYMASEAEMEVAAHAFDIVGWYWQHPVLTAWSWLTKPGTELTNPLVRQIWLALNGLLVLVPVVLLLIIKTNKPVAPDRDIRHVSHKKVKFDIMRKIERVPAGQVFLGLSDKRRQVRVLWSEMTEHVHVLGGSGSGKTSFAVIPICVQAIKNGFPTIVMDFKGDKQAVQSLAREARKAGKKFYFFTLHPALKSNTYNPLYYGSTLSKVERVMTALELVFAGQAKFYTYCQQAVFIPLLKYFDALETKYTLRDIWNILRDPELFEEITGEKMAPGQIKGLCAALTPYADADLNVINDPEPDIDLGRIMNHGDVAYFDLRSAAAPSLSSALGKMIAMELQARAAWRTQNDKITLLAIDEFQNMACQAFKYIISKVRSANYALLLANQALGDLRAVSEDFANTVATNTRTKMIFNIDDPEDAGYFAAKSGQTVIRVMSNSRSHGAGRITGKINNAESESFSDQDKHLIHKNVLLSMPFGKSVIFRRGKIAVMANHAHLVTKLEKDRLEKEPYPDPVEVGKKGVKTVNQAVWRTKENVINKHGQDQHQQRPGQVENAGVEMEDIVM
jgi:type IV secretory pathway TraG/TraD family ATPase VirD4